MAISNERKTAGYRRQSQQPVTMTPEPSPVRPRTRPAPNRQRLARPLLARRLRRARQGTVAKRLRRRATGEPPARTGSSAPAILRRSRRLLPTRGPPVTDAPRTRRSGRARLGHALRVHLSPSVDVPPCERGRRRDHAVRRSPRVRPLRLSAAPPVRVFRVRDPLARYRPES